MPSWIKTRFEEIFLFYLFNFSLSQKKKLTKCLVYRLEINVETVETFGDVNSLECNTFELRNEAFHAHMGELHGMFSHINEERNSTK